MENKIYITDDKGREYEMNILFTFSDNDKDYVVVYSNDNPDDLFAFIYKEDGSLIEIESEDEINMVNEVIEAFDKENIHVS